MYKYKKSESVLCPSCAFLWQKNMLVLMLATSLGMISAVNGAEIYYTNRTFTVVVCSNQMNRPADMLNTESKKLTETVKGEIQLTNTSAIEKQAAIPICYGSAEGAWDAAVAYNGSSESNYPGKTFDNVGWVRGTKSVNGDWGAYLWVIQNRLAFQASTSAWWTTNGVTVAITNVMVGSLGDYQPLENVDTNVPPISMATNFLGANQSETKEYWVDISNVFYQLSIPEIWITPRMAVTNVGGGNVQYTVTGTNITNGVTWSIIPSGLSSGAVIQASNDWHFASVTPGYLGTNYKVRATSVDKTNFYDQVNLTVISADLAIWNGGSDLDNGQTTGNQGSQVPDADEETVGAYLFVNWDDDDADGVMNSNGTWATLPVPDLTESSVANEDNLAQLKPMLEPLLNTGTVELEVSGADAGKVKLWTQSTKGTQITLTLNKKIWNLANSTEKAAFQSFMNDSYWVEGTNAGTAERGVTFTLRYKDSGGTEVCKDECKATVVMINLANAVYRDNMLWTQTARGHASLVWRYAGTCTKSDLTNDANFMLIEMVESLSDDHDLTRTTQQSGYPAYGCYRNPAMTYVQRLRIIAAARALVQRAGNIGYTSGNAVLPQAWDGHLDEITDIRCDGVVEVCYEINGVDVWGMERTPDNNTVHYNIGDPADNWGYNTTLHTWSQGTNSLPDNLEEHNDFDLVGWEDTLLPATQCGHVTPETAATQFGQQNLCQPIGSTGGN